MCGRYYLRKAPKNIRYGSLPEDFSQTKINPLLDLDRFNIAPSQKAPVLRIVDGDLDGSELRWGFLPTWMTKVRPQISADGARTHKVSWKHKLAGVLTFESGVSSDFVQLIRRRENTRSRT